MRYLKVNLVCVPMQVHSKITNPIEKILGTEVQKVLRIVRGAHHCRCLFSRPGPQI
jgi:hypothetical protein